MKAIRLHELEGPDEIVYEDVPEPEPGPGYAGYLADDPGL